MSRIGEPDGLTFKMAGWLGALMVIDEEALLAFLACFAIELGYTDNQAVEVAREFLPQYRQYLRREGVANA